MMSLNVAKCNLGKVNLEAMLSGSLWTLDTRVAAFGRSQGHLVTLICSGPLPLATGSLEWPRTLAGAPCDHCTHWAIRYHSQAHFASSIARKLRNFRPAHPSLGRSESLAVGW